MRISSNLSIENLVIIGPTATGKTQLAVQIAKKFNGEIISADSRQVYRGMDIGTGKDLKDYTIDGISIPYHLIDIIDPTENYNVAKFQADAIKISNKIKNKGILPIICGGTGFYIKALLMDFNIPETKPNLILRKKLEELSLNELIAKLETISEGASKRNLIDTKRRVIRAIEIENDNINHQYKIDSNNHSSNKINNYLVLGILYERDEIRQRITTRLNKRLESGMIEEVEKLIKLGVTKSRLESFGLEYRYLSRYLSGEINKLEMISLLNTAIHQFAKKQMTFFRNMEKNGIKINWIPKGNVDLAINKMYQA